MDEEIERDPRVLVVADDPLARAGLRGLVLDGGGWAVAGQAAGAPDLTVELEAYRPDVILWDLGPDPTHALEWVAALPRGGQPLVALLSDEAHVVEAWSSGARGLLLRDTDPETLVATLTAVGRGVVVVAPELATAILSPRGPAPPRASGVLTPRELQVLQRLAEGLPNKGIAERLAISEHTVKFHVNAIMGKLGAQSRTEAVAQATRLGLILL
jgi:DNA-binding NarL/FixJ family response regulator